MKSQPPNSASDPEVDPDEIVAAAEKAQPDVVAPEVDRNTENLTEWDEPPSVAGTAAPKTLPEDEVAIGEQLVDEGLEEADREQRIAAADPDFEP